MTYTDVTGGQTAPPTTPEGAGTGYPAHWEADVVASDGGIVHMRPILAADADALVRFHASLSERTRYLRFFGPYPHMSARDLKRFTVVDHHNRVAFICLLGDEIIAVGRYEGIPGAGGEVETAEVAFVARDEHQGRGLGSILLEHLAAAARENGLRRFEAEVLVENRAMVRVFRDAGYQVSRAFAEGVVHLEFDIDPTERSLAVRDSREQRAEARSVHNALHPSSVAVIGASTDPSKIGHAILANLLRANFTGPVFPVNAEARSVRGVRAYASVTDIPDPVDLAVVAVPSAGIDDVMDSCLAKGVTTLVVVSAGFADAGVGGLVAERRLVSEARAHGMRVIGPNALGVANTAPEVRLNATLAPDLPGRGRLGFFAQSGALGIAILAAARKRGLGLSTFVSAGNRADLSGNDLLQYWQTDPATDIVLLYLETFGNPRKFARVARRLARTKPIVAVKSGRHTGPVAALADHNEPIDDASVRALFEQAGVIRVDTLAELFDTALLLAYQPLPAGSRVAVVGNSTALGVLVADALLGAGMQVAGEPVDVGTTASPDEFAAAVAAGLHAETGADALVVVFVPPVATPGDAYAHALREAAAGVDKPVAAVFFAAEGVPAELAVPGPDGTPVRGSVPSFASPERAAAALARVARYARWRAEPVGDFTPPPGVDSDRGRALVADLDLSAADLGGADLSGADLGGGDLSAAERGAADHDAPDHDAPDHDAPDHDAPDHDASRAGADRGRALSDEETSELLACYGIALVEFRRVAGGDATVAAAEELGYPVAVKAVSDHWRYRPDLIGIRLDVVTPVGARRAHEDLSRLSGQDEMYVQRMAPKGVSCVLEIVEDPSFGSLISFGLAGTATELLGDRAFRVLPVSDHDAAALVRAPRAAPLLDGYRGAEPTDLAAMEDLARRVGRLAEDLPEVRSLALDPVIATPAGVWVIGARARLGPPPRRDDTGPRRLR